MTKYVFTKHRDKENQFDTTDVEITCYSCDRTELCEAFEEFLLACGFKFKGNVDIVEED